MSTLPTGLMITENQVVDALCKHLETEGWEIIQSLDTNTKGFDIVAKKLNQKLYIEAKGGTTSKDTNRKGLPFDRKQAKSHIGQSLWKSGEAMTLHPEAMFGVAFPKEKNHKELVSKITNIFINSKIEIFWVDKDLVVTKN